MSEVLFHSRPFAVPNGAYGCITFFFDPSEIDSTAIEKLTHDLTSMVEEYFCHLQSHTSNTKEKLDG
jgi:hypothetical protein